MPRALNAIPTYSEEGLCITIYLVSKVVGGRSEGIADSLIDLSWKTFKSVNAEVTDWWILKFPEKSDKNKKVRDSCNRHKKNRFVKYLELDILVFILLSFSQPQVSGCFHRIYPSRLEDYS
jgi:hypothetical protein